MLEYALPAPPLRTFVSHYWLSLNNAQRVHTVLPDGAVDLVIELSGTAIRCTAFGTAIRRAEVPVARGSHYLGVRFNAGQSRHFLGIAAHELTDASESAQGLLLFDLRDVPERLTERGVFVLLDTILLRHLAHRQPRRHGIDASIDLMCASRGMLGVDEAAAASGKSRRQFERMFLQKVGISPKFFARILRFQHASALMRSATPLVAVAADTGYSDQSHMSHDFLRLTGMSPAVYARSDVAFLQDLPPPEPDNGRLDPLYSRGGK